MFIKRKKARACLYLFLACMLCFSGCSALHDAGVNEKEVMEADGKDETSSYLQITGEEPDTADPQCTAQDYLIPLNVFDRLVEVDKDATDDKRIVPSLAKSWEISDDGMEYTFHLREGVEFSNGSKLTSQDVEYTLIRAITYPGSTVGDIGDFIQGAENLIKGKTDKLEGFNAHSDLDFTIKLSLPYSAFLALLSTPEYSILDKESTVAAGESFGIDPAVTVGTGPFIFSEWNHNEEMILTANQNCRTDTPGCKGIVIHIIDDPEVKRQMFEEGELDILDLENIGDEGEVFFRNDAYQDRLFYKDRLGLTLICLNESVEPLNDVRVRRALMLSLERNDILTAAYGGRGNIENGIYPHGLKGFNKKLPEISYDPGEAKRLLAEAGYSEGFDLEITLNNDSASYEKDIMELAAYMWGEIGVQTTITALDEEQFLEKRNSGKCACYVRKFSVDFDDPDAIVFFFFGSLDYAKRASLCYENKNVIDRVSNACFITDEKERIREYRELEQIIVQKDCAWIPLFSNRHYFVVNDRVENFSVAWNGWSDNRYHDVVIKEGA